MLGDRTAQLAARGDPDVRHITDVALARTATPLLRQLADVLRDEPVSLVLTDPDGLVLARFPGDPGSQWQRPDPGAARFGAPIRHPVDHRTVGLLDLSCSNRTADPFLAAIATTTAARIEEAIRNASGQCELALLRAYGEACRCTTSPVLATDGDVVMMNEAARCTLDPDDQSLLLDRTASGSARTVLLELADGSVAQVGCTPAGAGCARVLTVRFDPRPGPDDGSPAPPVLPGLAGSSPVWTRCCADARRGYLSGTPLLLLGEPGVGKLALAEAVHGQRYPGVFAQVLEAQDPAPDWLDTVHAALAAHRGTVVLRRLDLLPGRLLPDLVVMLTAAAADRGPGAPPWLVATGDTGGAWDAPGLLDVFGYRVVVPPLRERLPDLPDIAAMLLARQQPRHPLRCSSLALSILLRGRWPGNVTELQATLRTAGKRCRSGELRPEDLPTGCRGAGSRTLSPLESLERDAIVKILAATNGDKLAAAKGLQVSRATIYRKIRRYGIGSGDLDG